MKKLTIFLIALLLVSVITNPVYGQWKKLVKKDLSGWEQLNGNATFKLEKGLVIGTTVSGSENSFLCTKEKYGDFILEFDTWFDPKMNSGVQFRSESRPDYQNGRVHGYQVELDPSERAWSGGIYDEARRGWLYTLDKNPKGQKALKVGEWNHYRVEAIGNSIRTWINGIPCADLVDAMTPKGFIALQVHSVGKDESRVGLQVKWKKIRIVTENLDKYKTPYTTAIPQVSFLDNILTEREVNEGWKLLFDGKSTAGWMNARTKTTPATGWEVKEETLVISSATRGKGGGGDIVTVDKFGNFELIVDFKYGKGANSGIKYFVDTESNNGSLSSIGCEYQVLDDRTNSDAKAGVGGNHTLSALYDLIAPVNKRDNGDDNWNRAVIIVDGNKCQHWLNGQLTVDYERGTDAWRELVAKSKFRNSPGFGEKKEGRILLQDHPGYVAFKNIKIREIK